MTTPGLPIDVRFWLKVRIGEHDECWPWTGALTSAGYGNFGITPKQNVLAHRFAMQISGAELGQGRCVLHRCDNPPCCNPTHLRVGTLSDNTQDMIAKGRHHPASGERSGMRLHPERQVRGEAVGTSKLSEEKVRQIRARRAGEQTLAAIAREFKVSYQTVWMVASGRAWAHVT